MTTRDFHHFINGAFVASSSGATFDKRRPSDNEVIGRVAEGGVHSLEFYTELRNVCVKL